MHIPFKEGDRRGKKSTFPIFIEFEWTPLSFSHLPQNHRNSMHSALEHSTPLANTISIAVKLLKSPHGIQIGGSIIELFCAVAVLIADGH